MIDSVVSFFIQTFWLGSEATSLSRPGRESYTHAWEDLKWRQRGKYGFWALFSMHKLKLRFLIDKRPRYISCHPFGSSAFISPSECKIHDARFCQPLGNGVSNEVNRKIPSAQTPGESKQQIKQEQTSESHLSPVVIPPLLSLLPLYFYPQVLYQSLPVHSINNPWYYCHYFLTHYVNSVSVC